jgi:hypothetical protein
MRQSPVGVSHAEPTLWLFLERNLLRHSVFSGHFNFVQVIRTGPVSAGLATAAF